MRKGRRIIHGERCAARGQHGADIGHAQRATAPTAEAIAQDIQPAAVLFNVVLHSHKGHVETHAAINARVAHVVTHLGS